MPLKVHSSLIVIMFFAFVDLNAIIIHSRDDANFIMYMYVTIPVVPV